jgi:hypothetical protein
MSPEDHRLAVSIGMSPVGQLSTRGGCVPGGLSLTGTSAMQATLSPGRAWIQGTSTAAQGGYAVTVDTGLPLTFANGDPAYGRIDAVVVRVRDNSYDGSGQTAGLVEVITGVPAAVPVAPAAPDSSEKLFEVTVPVNASAGNGGILWATAVADRRRFTSALGGITPPGGGTGFSGTYAGQYRDANNQLERWNGTAWGQYPAVPAWQSWTPVWTTSSGVAVSFGNSSVNCRYIRSGPTVHLTFQVIFGSTANFGSTKAATDNWRFSLPVPAATQHQCLGFAELSAGVTASTVARLRCDGGTGVFGLNVSSGRPDATALPAYGWVDSITPWTWVSGSFILATATYEVAG